LIGVLGTRMFTTSALKEYKYSPDILGYLEIGMCS
jgi:hypothetical protein